jgi:hypothetical protein
MSPAKRFRTALTIAAASAALVVTGVTPASAGPPTVTVSIQPTSGLAGSAITVNVTVTGECTGGGIGLKNPATNNYVALDPSIAVPASGKFSGTLNVPMAAAPGTVYHAEGGCLQPTAVVGPPVAFVVTAPNASATPTVVVPLAATVAISPSKGLPGTSIQTTLTFNAPDACTLAVIALRNTAGPAEFANIIDLSLALAKQPNGSFVGTLQVPAGAAPGTVYHADGGCIAPLVISPPQPFLVIAPDVTAFPWWQYVTFGLDGGLSSLLALLDTEPPFPLYFPGSSTTSTTDPARGTSPTTPPTQTSTSSSTTSTTRCERECR